MSRPLSLGLALSLSLSACAASPAPGARDPMAERSRAAEAGDHETGAAREQAAEPPRRARDAEIHAEIVGTLRPGSERAEAELDDSPVDALDDVTDAGQAEGAGSGGLGLREPSGEGGGGTSEGLAGLGTRGTGSGYGRGAPRPAATVHLGTVYTTGSLDRDVVERIVRRRLNQIGFCYERELSSAPALTGQLTIRLDVGARGRVTGTQISSSSMPDTVNHCVESVSRRTRFPEVEGGATVTLPYRFGA
ncbi:MAG: AgmX/PglI C-terminal domain-containing protein [Myxococcota bacterium]|nr:AgmX/PglI C-terminal domain-containing protein [Myxococcota bacterium]